MNAPHPLPGGHDDVLRDIERLTDIPAILNVCARVTGMGYAVVAHVTEDRWRACAVLDEVEFGLPVGGELPIQTTLCSEVRAKRATIAFDHASQDARWSAHHTPRAYGLESYIASPIILSNGDFFGTLCAIDPKPASASAPTTVAMFELFAKLIASQIEAGRKLARSEAALLDASATAELRDQFIAILGHDLRNPLAAIDAGTLLLDRRVGSEAKPILSEMRGSVRRIERLINDVLDFARGRLGGGLSVSRRRADELPAILAQVVDELRAAHRTRDIRANIDLQTVPACDPDRIAQLASNLLANAVIHGAKDPPVELSAKTDSQLFELSVRNQGEPIPPELISRLFQPFSRKGSGLVRDGLGLGLYISNEIARAHGGKLTVVSDESGTEFRFSMPLT